MFEDITFIAWNGLIGGLLPLVISALKQTEWSKNLKRLFSAGIALGAAVISAAVSLDWEALELAKVMEAGIVIFPMAQATYLKFWSGTKVEAALAESLQVHRKTDGYQGP